MSKIIVNPVDSTQFKVTITPTIEGLARQYATQASASAVQSSGSAYLSSQSYLASSASAAQSLNYSIASSASAYSSDQSYLQSSASAYLSEQSYLASSASAVDSLVYSIASSASAVDSLNYSIASSASAFQSNQSYLASSASAFQSNQSYLASSASATQSFNYSVASSASAFQSNQSYLQSSASAAQSLTYSIASSGSAVLSNQSYLQSSASAAESLTYSIASSASAYSSDQSYLQSSASAAQSLNYSIASSASAAQSLNYSVASSASASDSLTYYLLSSGSAVESDLAAALATEQAISASIARNDAETAKIAAQNSEDNALDYSNISLTGSIVATAQAVSASLAQTAASASAASALSSQILASGSAVSALSSQILASDSAVAASISQISASGSAASASASATSASASAASAAASAASAAQVGTSTLLTGFSVGANSTIAATDSILQAFNKTQGQINARVSGTIASGQVAFGTGVNTVGGSSLITYNSTDRRLRIDGTNGAAAISSTMHGIDLVVGSANASSQYFPAIKWLSIDPQFVTNTPRLIALITANASQTYSTDDSSGAGIIFWTSPINNGAANLPIQRWSILENGNFVSLGNFSIGVNTTAPTQTIDVNGTGRIRNGVSLADTSGNVQIGTTTDAGFRLDVNGTTRLNGLQTFQGTTASDTAPLGTELATTGSGTNWTGTDFATGYTHTAGSTAPLTTSTPAVSGTYYQIAYTITGRTAGSITINYGGTSTASITATGATGPLATSTANLEIVPTTDFDGNVVLSVRSIGTSSATTTINDSGGNARIQIRATNALSNVLFGLGAGRRITSGTSNSFFGNNTGINNTTGTNNSFFGRDTGLNNNIGSFNSFFGVNAGLNNTTGISNSFFGTSAGQINTTGSSNSFFGVNAGLNNTTGNNNTFIGSDAGRLISSGTNLTVSTNSVFLGFGTRANADSETNQTVIGYQAIGLGSNTTVIGNSSTTFGRWWGNLLLGTSTNSGFTLDVAGSTRIVPPADTTGLTLSGYSLTGSSAVPAIDISGTWNTTGTPTLIRANVTDTASNSASLLMNLQVGGVSQFRIRRTGEAVGNRYFIGTTVNNDLYTTDGTSGVFTLNGSYLGLRFSGDTTAGFGLTIGGFNTNTRTNTSGLAGILSLFHGFAPTSGTGTFIGLQYTGVINQTGGANGITRGLFVNPTLTSAADWRSIEWSNNTGWGLYGTGTAPNYLNGNLLIGSTANNAKLYVAGGISGTNQRMITVQPFITNAQDTLVNFNSAVLGSASVTVTNLIHFNALAGVPSPSTYTNNYGFNVANSFTFGTFNYGFYGDIPSGAGRWNLFMNGTANNYLRGNLLLNTTTDAGFLLDVNGTARITPPANSTALTVSGYSLTGSDATSAVNISGTWNTTGTPTLIFANVTDTASNASSLLMDLRVGGSTVFSLTKRGLFRLKGSGSTDSVIRLESPTTTDHWQLYQFSTDNSLRFNYNGVGVDEFVLSSIGELTTRNTFAPTSGSTNSNSLRVISTINQTGGANGITRGLFIDPTLTSATDWRSIEWSNNTGWGIRGVGTADNALAGNLHVGSVNVANASAILELTSTTKGLLLPRMTGAEAELINSPTNGLLVYINNGNGTTITSTGFWGRDAGVWVKLN